MAIRTEPKPYCPECGAKMTLRYPKPNQDWEPFWGCNRYPNCDGARQINTENGVPEGDEYDN